MEKQYISYSKSNSISDQKDKPSARPEETVDPKQKNKKWLERQYKNMKKDMEILSSEAVENEDLFF